MPTTDPWTLYARTRDQLIDLVGSLDTNQAALTVPLTPGWTITEVVAHLCGLNADVAEGRRQGLGTDERTAHQVAVRAGHSVEEISQEWRGHEGAMQSAIAENTILGLRLAADLIIHVHDVQHALSMPIDQDDEATVSAGRTYASFTPDRLAGQGLPHLTIELSDGSCFGVTDEVTQASLVLRATPYDFLRSVTGRRSRPQIEALDWTGDPTPILAHLCPYGPLRTVDADI